MGVSIRIPPDNEKSNIIRIEGNPEGVALAKKELLDMVTKMVRRFTLTLSDFRMKMANPLRLSYENLIVDLRSNRYKRVFSFPIIVIG